MTTHTFLSLRNCRSFAIKSIAACAVFIGSTGLFAQNLSPADPRQVTQNIAQLSASGTMEVQQDLLAVTMNAIRDGVDAAAVQKQLKETLDAALTLAKSTAAPGQMDVRTGNFSLYPRYGKDGSKIAGWQGTAEMVLEGRDFDRITTTAGKIQGMTLGNIGFSLSREQRTKVEAQAQAQAIERFKAKAEEIAKSFGFTSYTLREVQVSASDQGYGPRPRMMAMQAKTANAEMADSPVPVEAGKTTVLVNVSGAIQMR